MKRLATLTAVSVLLLTSSAAAQPRPVPPAAVDTASRDPMRWDPRWPKFRTEEYIATGLMAAVAFGSLAIPVATERWTTVNGFDAEVRDTLRLSNPARREEARDASDVLLTLLVNQLIVDNLMVTWWAHELPEEALQMALMDFEALALTSAVNGIVAGLASRERPYREACVGPEELQTRDCVDSKRYRSFFSGHTSTSFTVAGLVCVHHAHMPIYGGGAPDALACGTAFLAAAAVGLMRIASDQHFATDVLTGAAVGVASGLGLPWLLHYRGGATPPAGRRRSDTGGLSVRFAPAPLGGYLIGAF